MDSFYVGFGQCPIPKMPMRCRESKGVWYRIALFASLAARYLAATALTFSGLALR